MRVGVIIGLSMSLAGCGDEASETAKVVTESAARNIAHKESRADIGRFSYHPPAGEMPALIFDSATGCVETFEKLTMDDNPKDIRWARRFADMALPKVTYVNGQPRAVEGSAPPSRCFTFERNKE